MATLEKPAGYVSGYSSKVPSRLHEEIFWRIWNGEKSKRICHEYGVCARTIEHITRHVAKDLGAPVEEWRELKRRRRQENWQRMREIFAYRDQQFLIEGQEQQHVAALAQARIEAADLLERKAERQRARERQHRLNARAPKYEWR